MKLPLSWLSDFVTFPKNISTEKIAEAFVKVGFEVEGIIEPGSRIKGPVKIATVLSIKELTEHKKPIRYVGLDAGERKTRFVICGATNFKVGDKVVVAIPGAILPGDFRISARETYGHLSDGMICSGRELGISEDHAGIIVLDSSNKAKNGSDALTALGADDPIFDIAVNPDRGYAMSIRGAARELAMALNLKFTDIDRKAIIGKIQRMKKPGKTVPVAILDKKAADLIYLRTLSGFNPLSKTPDWMARRIAQAGMRSISLAVDVTNYVMLEIGQPLHAFDAAKIEGRLQVQRAGKHKSLTTLDGEKRKLTSEDILIADSKKPLALGGTMGGLESEVSEKTTRLAIEAAHFISESIARQSRSHQLSTEASRRFERGVDPALAELASARAVELLLKYGGANYHGFSTQGSLPPNKKV
ncbi:MAG: phenylalanine--tRNA ligase subunit beta, partial [Candidatus Nanopelagicaceae bacterium]